MVGDRVVYWMQSSQRTVSNHALEHAISIANASNLPLDVLFVIDPDGIGGSKRSFQFLLHGLEDVATGLRERGINLSIRIGGMVRETLSHCDDAAVLIMDKGHLRQHRQCYEGIQESVETAVHQVDDNVVVPTGIASDKEEWSAATLRRKITPQIPAHLDVAQEIKPSIQSDGIWGDEFAWKGIEYVSSIVPCYGPEPSPYHVGGQYEAIRRWRSFLENGMARYPDSRNEPSNDGQSGMSPYLHHGQISPVMLAAEAWGRPGSEAFLEELIVRRELAVNFTTHNERYDDYACIPDWASKTLDEHSEDHREYIYTIDELESADTHDPYWNAAQGEMLASGKMHGYMRMYWGKKILEWSETPQDAYRAAVELNDRYELDGRDPNGYAGVAWCFGKHDRPWKEREIFGKVRYMNAKGLERKFFMPGYVDRVISMMERTFENV